jgi:hypothetical protein
MTSSNSIHVNAADCRIAILRYELRRALRFRARHPEIDDARNPLTAHAAIGSQQERGCSKEHAR